MRRTLAVAAVVATVGAAAIAAFVVWPPGSGGRDDDAIVRPAAAAPVSTLAVADAAEALAPPLPQPADAPEDAYADVAVEQIGEIEIPRIGLVHPVYEGIWLTVIDHGPGHWPGSAVPGGYGNTTFAGHRVTNSRPFRHIDELVPGDEVIFRTDRGAFTYRVTGSEVVRPEDTRIVTQTPGYRMTIFACHPPGSAEFRLAVFGDLVRSEPPAGL